jgi:adenine phosphoribosyltransferase
VNAEFKQRLLAAYRWVDPGPHVTHLVSDTSGWWRDSTLLAQVGPALAALFPGAAPTAVLSPQISGVLVGPLAAQALGAGFVEAYRDERVDQMAEPVLRAVSQPDYKGRIVTLGFRARHLTATDRVLVVDDWAASGAQLATLHELVTLSGATYLGAAVIVDACPPAIGDKLDVRGLLHPADLETRVP